MNTLAVPATPAQLAAAGSPIHDALWVETVVAEAFAPAWRALTVPPCARCGASGGEPCRKPSGRATRRHEGRGRAS